MMRIAALGFALLSVVACGGSGGYGPPPNNDQADAATSLMNPNGTSGGNGPGHPADGGVALTDGSLTVADGAVCASPSALCLNDAGTNNCVNLSNNVSNCGTCNFACPAGETCVSFLCQ
jgi:hypothetical protein